MAKIDENGNIIYFCKMMQISMFKQHEQNVSFTRMHTQNDDAAGLLMLCKLLSHVQQPDSRHNEAFITLERVSSTVPTTWSFIIRSLGIKKADRKYKLQEVAVFHDMLYQDERGMQLEQEHELGKRKQISRLRRE